MTAAAAAAAKTTKGRANQVVHAFADLNLGLGCGALRLADAVQVAEHLDGGRAVRAIGALRNQKQYDKKKEAWGGGGRRGD